MIISMMTDDAASEPSRFKARDAVAEHLATPLDPEAAKEHERHQWALKGAAVMPPTMPGGRDPFMVGPEVAEGEG